MAATILHQDTCGKTDGADATRIQPSWWNKSLKLGGFGAKGAIPFGDASKTAGLDFIEAVAAGQQIVSAGAAAAPVWRPQSVINVMNPPFNAAGNGTTDDTAAIQAAVTACPAAGGTVLLPQSHLVTGVTDGGKPIWFVGATRWSAVRGVGVPLITLTALGSRVVDLGVNASASSDGTIGVLLDNGSDGMGGWTLRGCWFGGAFASPYRGIAVKGRFALEGVIDDCQFLYWATGIQLEAIGGDNPNANSIRGCKIRQGIVGVNLVGGIDDLYLDGNTIEGNVIGLQSGLAGGHAYSISLVNNHWENNQGGAAATNLSLTDTALMSLHNYYGGCAAYRDIVVNTPTYYGGTIQSRGDNFGDGVTHNGNGQFVIYDAYPSSPTLISKAGTGTIRQVREGMLVDALPVGFYGHTAAAQQVLATGVTHTVDDVIRALQALGLLKQS